MKTYYNESKFYNRLEEAIGAVLLAIMVVMLFVQVIMRYVFKTSAAWISEYALYMFMYFVFLACSGAFLRNDHIQIIALIEKLPERLKAVANLFLYIVNMIFVSIVAYVVFLRVLDQIQMKTVSITQFPLWLMSASLLVGMAASAIRCLMNIYFIIRYEFINRKEER